jgi:serine/threonine protein kinase
MPPETREGELTLATSPRSIDAPSGQSKMVMGRTTILPRIELRGSRVELAHEVGTRFEPVQTLGQGAAAEVMLVKDRDIDRLVAVKRLRTDKHDPHSLARFVEEVRTTGQLEHPNIAPLHDVGRDENGQYYLVLKHVEGETLESIIEKLAAGDAAYHRRFTFEYRALVFRDILRAIEYAHSRGIIHRDLKPANIMIGPNGEVTVMDWGLAKKIRRGTGDVTPPSEELRAQLDTVELKAADEQARAAGTSSRVFATEHGSILGTPAYMAPEQALGRNDQVDERSDIYSLAALFYRFLTLHHYIPLKRTVAEMLQAVVHEEPLEATPRSFVEHGPQPVVPRELSMIVKRGLAKDPASRHQSVHDMIEELQRCFEGRHCVVCIPTLVKRTGSALRRGIDGRSELTIGATAGAIFAAVALALYGAFELVRSRNPYALALVAGVFLIAIAGAFISPRLQNAQVRLRNRKLGFG